MPTPSNPNASGSTRVQRTNLEIFQTVSAHLIAQGRQAMSADGETCAYLAPDGARCAVGCLISPDAYTRAMEGATVSMLDEALSMWAPDTMFMARANAPALAIALNASDVPVAARGMLHRLQEFHDSWSQYGRIARDPGFVAVALERIAAENPGWFA